MSRMEENKTIFESWRGDQHNKTFVRFQLFQFGRDMILLIGGGMRHIGSVAASDDGASTIRQFTIAGHKEDQIVKQAVEILSPLISGEILVIGGIHYDNITPEQIRRIQKNCSELLGDMTAYLAGQPVTPSH